MDVERYCSGVTRLLPSFKAKLTCHAEEAPVFCSSTLARTLVWTTSDSVSSSNSLAGRIDGTLPICSASRRPSRAQMHCCQRDCSLA